MRKQSKLVYTDDGTIHIESWLQNVTQARAQSNLNLLREAIVLAQYTGEAHATPNGESCLHQGLAMAEILIELNLDDESLAAAIVYSSLMYADLSIEDITEHLGTAVAKLVNGTQKMDAIHSLHGKLSHQTHLANTIDNLRKMMLAMVEDVRVVIIKLAERLCILRNMLLVKEEDKKRIARETMDIYAPLANRLGIGHLKWPLEDLSFRYLEPNEYHTISKALKSRRSDREQYVQQIISILKTAMQDAGINPSEVSGRAKHIYSIYRKMQRKNVAVEKIYDAIAFRILVPSIEDCYAAISIVHGLWEHIPEEFDDYIVKPKSNGYRSIHTAVVGPENKFIEIQIRTYDMHQDAELGVAAHWLYKEGPQATAGYEAKISWLRQVMDWQKEVTPAGGEDKEIYSHIFEDRIYVFTPNGDVIELPKGSTPLDFAYNIHSEIGHNCRGAKVNGSIVPLTYTLNSSEKVEILITSRGHPSRDWLNPHLGYLRTPRAKAKVLNWFRRQDHDKNLSEGHDLLDKELRRLGIKELSFDDLATKMNFKNKEDMFVALGRGDLRIHNVMQIAQQMVEPPSSKTKMGELELPRHQVTTSSAPTDVLIEGVRNLLTHLAGCCKPIPGDSIIGYITIGKGVSIHRSDCENISQLSPDNDRILQVSWGGKTQKRYPVDLNITAQDHHDIVRDISGLLANDRVPIVSINILPNRRDNTTFIRLTIEIDSLEPLSRIVAHLQQLPNIINVSRD